MNIAGRCRAVARIGFEEIERGLLIRIVADGRQSRELGVRFGPKVGENLAELKFGSLAAVHPGFAEATIDRRTLIGRHDQPQVSETAGTEFLRLRARRLRQNGKAGPRIASVSALRITVIMAGTIGPNR